MMTIPPLDRVKRIVFVGASITQMGDPALGWPAAEPLGYVGIAREILEARGIEVINHGIGGHKSTDMLARFRASLAAQPDIITLNAGLNDVWHGFDEAHPLGGGPNSVDLSSYRHNVSAMIKLSIEAEVPIIILSPTAITEDRQDPRNVLLSKYVEAERLVCEDFDVRFVDLHAAFFSELDVARSEGITDHLVLTTDGVHMNKRGGQFMARELFHILGL